MSIVNPLKSHSSLIWSGPMRPVALAALLCLSPWAAIAQSSVSSPSAKDDGAGSQRVEVTSGKRKQLQADVAGTVTAVTGAQLERLGSVDAEDVLKLTPGVQFNKGPADASLLSIRGIGTNGSANNQGFTQAPTGIYIEDIPFTDPFAFVSVPDLAPFDMERVEVLRGPQGALYGSSSLGGAIRYILSKPDTKRQEGSVLLGFNSMAGGGTGWTSAAMANLPLADGKAGLRMVVNSRKDPGFIDNIGTGEKDSNTNRVNGGRLLFTYKPHQDFDLTAIYMRQGSAQAGGSGVSSFNFRTGQGYSKFYDELKVDTGIPQRFNSSFDLATVQANWNIGALRVTSLTGRQSKDRELREDFSRDFYEPAYKGDVWSSDTGLKSVTRSQEIRVSPRNPSANINWLVGAFWMDADVKRDQKVYFEPRGKSPDIRIRRFGQAKESSIFGDVEFKLTPALTASAGARFYKTELNYDRIVGISDAGDSVLPYGTSDSGSTPKVSLRYALSPTSAVYAMASRGYRFGGISNLGLNPVGRPYKSDSLWNYEAGWRWTPSKEASLDISVFHIDWKDVQLSELFKDPVSGRSFLVTGNIGKAVSQGVEAAAAWRPSAFLSVRGSVALTDATTSGGLNIGGTLIPDGTRLPGTARVQGMLDVTTYFTGIMGSSGRLSTLVSHTGDRMAQIDSDIKLPAYSTVDMRLTYAWTKVEVAAFVNNLANARGISGAVDYFTTYAEFYPIRPRNVGMAVRYDF